MRKKGSRYLPGEICSAPGCDRRPEDISLCDKHAQRFRRYGDVNYLTPESERAASQRTSQLKRFEGISTHYRKFHGRHEHRVVMEAHLGRPLAEGEIVHHRDGNRRNNAIENLQVMTQSDHMKGHLAEMRVRCDAAKKKKSKRIEFNGESKTFKEWSTVTGLTISTIYCRLRSGWDVGKALGLA